MCIQYFAYISIDTLTLFIMSFTKSLQSASRKAKSTASTMIGNNLDFCCQITDDISISQNDDTIYPKSAEIVEWFDKLFTKEFKLKVLPAKALENMKKRGIPIKKQPAEIMNFVISTSEYHVHVGVMLPQDSEYKANELFVGFIDQSSDDLEQLDRETYSVVTYRAESPLKEKDNVRRRIFEYLRKIGVSTVEDDSDDEIYNLDDDDSDY
jgi:hypothetical protein